jgi:hypothetical protein
MRFVHSRRKVERAAEHIRDLNELLNTFIKSDFYAVTVKEYKGRNVICLDIDKTGLDKIRAAIIVGDALHNLRSALDILYYQAFNGTTAKADKWTRFPIFEERDKLISGINGGLKEKGLADDSSALKIRDCVVDVVKAYQAGNFPLWALHEMNILDKHQLLIELFDVMRFTDISLKDEREEIFLADRQPYYTEETYQFKIERSGRLTVHDKGRAAVAIAFNVGFPYQGESIIQALDKITKSVSGTIDAFDALGLRGFFD